MAMTHAALQTALVAQGVEREHGLASADAAVIKRLIKRSTKLGSYVCRAAAAQWRDITLDRSAPTSLVIKRLIIGQAPAIEALLDAGRNQACASGPGISLLCSRIIKRLIIGQVAAISRP